ncbi:hypothetical protein [Sphingomonas sp.]|uniref:hypothetical protein n=1 Tax=Sphingomonas sp. TaxID=28214 RepID=UPI0025F533D4|nr:hypothetical protein [Sphingomonas sp.]
MVVVIAGIAAFALGFINIDKTKDGKLPAIRAEGGQMPGFDVKTGKVEVGTKKTTVDVPTVGTHKETIETPTIGVKKAN